MKFTLTRNSADSYWNGVKPLPNEINVLHYHPQMAEFELLSILCTLHGFVTAFDILTGAETGSEKDADIISVMTAFQHYISPKMPLSNYTGSDKRTKPVGDKKVVPIDSNGV